MVSFIFVLLIVVVWIVSITYHNILLGLLGTMIILAIQGLTFMINKKSQEFRLHIRKELEDRKIFSWRDLLPP